MIKIGLLGTGHLGKIHLKLLKQIKAFEVVGIYDADPATATKVSQEFGVQAYDSAQALIAACDALDIVTPTLTHYETASAAIKQFKHVFIEKPITTTTTEAQGLVDLAREAGVKGMVGHVERYNPAFLAAEAALKLQPSFLEIHRLALWNPRGTDVSVVLDLMIHDIDLMHHLVGSSIKRISANGVCIISDSPDIANARIEFHNGCVANLTASRIATSNMRKVRLYQSHEYVSIDLLAKSAAVFKLQGQKLAKLPEGTQQMEFSSYKETKYVTQENITVKPVNSIQLELEHFARAIETNTEPPISLFDAANNLNTAVAIEEKIMKGGNG